MMINEKVVASLVRLALNEDIGGGDITAALIPAETQIAATVISREPGILCGTQLFSEVFRHLNATTLIDWHRQDGDLIQANETLCTLSGNARTLLTGERAALNFLQLMSGTATMTQRYVSAINHTQCQILDTRKTLPGLRALQKYAVKCGGGNNHRLGLFDAYLIKENHIAACGSITQAIQIAKQHHPDKKVEVEVESLAELDAALNAQADIIMLDNFDLSDTKEAVTTAKGKAKLEASGNITLANIANIAETGVDYISIGALTKNVQALDLSMRSALSALV